MPDAAERRAMMAACEALIPDVLRPAHVPASVPTEFNCLVDITVAYAGGRYRFIRLCRSEFADTLDRSSTSPLHEWTAWGGTASMFT